MACSTSYTNIYTAVIQHGYNASTTTSRRPSDTFGFVAGSKSIRFATCDISFTSIRGLRAHEGLNASGEVRHCRALFGSGSIFVHTEWPPGLTKSGHIFTPAGVLTNSYCSQRELSLRCPKNHEHVHLFGGGHRQLKSTTGVCAKQYVADSQHRMRFLSHVDSPRYLWMLNGLDR